MFHYTQLEPSEDIKFEEWLKPEQQILSHIKVSNLRAGNILYPFDQYQYKYLDDSYRSKIPSNLLHAKLLAVAVYDFYEELVNAINLNSTLKNKIFINKPICIFSDKNFILEVPINKFILLSDVKKDCQTDSSSRALFDIFHDRAAQTLEVARATSMKIFNRNLVVSPRFGEDITYNMFALFPGTLTSYCESGRFFRDLQLKYFKILDLHLLAQHISENFTDHIGKSS